MIVSALVIASILGASPISVPCRRQPSIKRNPFQIRYCEADVPLLDLTMGEPNINDMASTIDIGGTVVAASIQCEGVNATASDWDCVTDTLALSDVGTDFTIGTGSPFGDATGVDFPSGGGDHYVGTSSSVGELGTDDWVYEFVFRTGVVLAERRFFSKYSVGESRGIVGRVSNSGQVDIFVQGDSGSTSIVTGAGTLVANTWYHVIVYGEYGDEAQIFVNGTSGGAATDISMVGDMTNTGTIALGGAATAPHFDLL